MSSKKLKQLNIQSINLSNSSPVLIEASAGTGKTYSLKFLVLRIIFEAEVELEQILVSTFTNVATNELQLKITKDIEQIGKVLYAKNLKKHLLSIEDKNLCILLQRLLTEKGVSKLKQIYIKTFFNLHKLDVLTNDKVFIKLCRINYFLLQINHNFEILKPESKTKVTHSLIDKYLLIKFQQEDLYTHYLRHYIGGINSGYLGYKYQELDNQKQLINIASLLNQINTWNNQDWEKLYLYVKDSAIFTANALEKIKELSKCKEFSKTIECLSLLAKGIKTINGKKYQSLELLNQQLSNNYSEQADIFAQLLNACKANAKVDLELYRYLNLQIRKYKEDHNLLDYEDISNLLADYISKYTQQPEENKKLLHKYKYIFIDEFQDSNAKQWHIFSALTKSIFVIGDPKQAIYAFRGGEIKNFITTKQTIARDNIFYIQNNYRSNPDYIQALNFFYQIKNPFQYQGVDYYDLHSGTKKNVLKYQGKTKLNKIYSYYEKCTDTELQQRLVEHIKIITTSDFALDGNPIKYNDIAILCNTNEQLLDFGNALLTVGMPYSIYSVKFRILEQNEAKLVFTIMQTIFNPSLANLKTLLLYPYFFNTYKDYQDLFNNTILVQNYQNHFVIAKQIWQNKNFYLAWQYIAQKLGIFQNILKTTKAKRIYTNLQHVLDLIFELEYPDGLFKISLNKLYLQLQQQMLSPEKLEEEPRIDDSINRVKLYTIHNAKGLEFPLTFIYNPELTNPTKRPDPSNEYLRKFYVAITRSASASFIYCNKWQENCLAKDYFVHLNKTKKNFEYDLAPIFSTTKNNNIVTTKTHGNPIKVKIYDLNKKSKLLHEVHNIATSYSGLNQFTEIKQIQANQDNVGNTQHYDITEYYELNIKDYDQEQTQNTLAGISKDNYSVNNSKLVEKGEKQQSPLNFATKFKHLQGVNLGNIFHQIMEKNNFQDLVSNELQQLAQEQITNLLSGQIIGEYDLEQLQKLIKTSILASLSSNKKNLSLISLDKFNSIKELYFNLQIKKANFQQFNKIISKNSVLASITRRFNIHHSSNYLDSLSGYMKGFIDLIYQFEGKYYLLDYKTNLLEQHTKQGLIAEMQKHNYGLQLIIYSLALDKILEKQINDYCYKKNFAEVQYFFVRGVLYTKQQDNYLFRYKIPFDTMQQIKNCFYN